MDSVPLSDSDESLLDVSARLLQGAADLLDLGELSILEGEPMCGQRLLRVVQKPFPEFRVPLWPCPVR